MRHLYTPDRFEPDPDKRTTSCPVAFTQETSVQINIPQAQQMILEAKTQREEAAVLASIAKSFGICSNSPETFFKLEEIEGRAEKQRSG
jgi:hypothetical protein